MPEIALWKLPGPNQIENLAYKIDNNDANQVHPAGNINYSPKIVIYKHTS